MNEGETADGGAYALPSPEVCFCKSSGLKRPPTKICLERLFQTLVSSFLSAAPWDKHEENAIETLP